MTDEFTKGRFKALALVSQFLKCPSRELLLESIHKDIKEEDLRWVTDRFHYYTLRLKMLKKKLSILENPVITR